MVEDFKALQVQTNKIIASGSTGRNAQLLVYPRSKASDNSGTIDATKFPATGIGVDTFLYISGAVGGKDGSGNDITVFGGDIYVSGNLHVNSMPGVSGADPDAEYLVVNVTSSLANEKSLVAGPNITLNDYTTAIGLSGSSGGADISASYVVIDSTSSLPQERNLVGANGISVTNNGSTVAIAAGSSTNNYIFHPDALPTSSHSMNDEFTGSYAIGAPSDWTMWDIGLKLTASYVDGKGFYHMKQNGFSAINCGIYKSIPSGSTEFTLISKVATAKIFSAHTYFTIGVFAGENLASNPSSSNLVTSELSTIAVSNTGMIQRTVNAYNAFSISPTTVNYDNGLTSAYVRLRVSGTYAAADCSKDGLAWINFVQMYDTTFTFSTVGLISIIKNTATGYQADCIAQFFRFYDNTSDFDFIPGEWI